MPRLPHLPTLYAYGILDTEREAPFDAVVRDAAQACVTPMALVSFIDRHRQWFKAEIGFGLSQTSLDQSICLKAIEHEDVFVVTNAEVDPRVNSNPLVYGNPGIRFYAGAPLISPAGVAVGMVCVLDTKVRPNGVTSEQALMLRALAWRVMTLLSTRHQF